MRTTGACFCGAIRYQADVDENRVGICHCRDCQIFSGSAFRMAAFVQPQSFELTGDEPKFFDKRSESGKVRRMVFCGACGTHICSTSPDLEEAGANRSLISLRIATSRDFSRFKPVGELWCQSKLPWVPEIDGAIKFDRQPQ